MSEIREEIKSILKKINKKKKEIEEILKKKDREYEMFFMNLSKEIIIELKNLNKENTNDEPKNYFLKYDKNFLYEMIKLFIDMKKNNISNEAIESVIIIKENIEVILTITITINKNINIDSIQDEEINKFNNNIINLITEFMNLNQKILIDCFILNKDNNLHDFLLIFSKYKTGRNFLYDCERIIFLLFPDYENYKIFIEFMNYAIDSINQQLNEDSFLATMEEIQLILYIYKNHISIISNSMIKLLIKILKINEKIQKENNNKNKNNFNQSINNLLRYCFDRVVFIYSDNMNINSKGNNEIKNRNKFQYNKDFMDFLLDTYSELIVQKLKNSYSDFLMELFLGIDNIGTGTKKYIWLVNETKYPQTVLKSLIELKDFNLLSLYFSKILFLSVPNLTEYYIPEYDIKFFISKLDTILNNENEEENEQMFNIISSQIINLININKIDIKNDIIDILINKCSLINIFILIINSDNYSNNIKNKLINFVENIFSINNNNIKFSLNIPITNHLDLKNNFDINDVNTYGIKYKIYLLSLEYDFDITEYHNKLNLIINNIMSYYLEKKKIIELILFGDILLKSILIDNKFKYINELNSEIIAKINNIYIQASTILFQDENIIESDKSNIINKFIYQISNFIREFNKKCFKFRKNNLCKYNQFIFQDNTIIKIFNNIFMQTNDISFKQKIICNFFIIYSNENEINRNNSNENNNIILESSFLIMIILQILFEMKDYQSLLFLYTKLVAIINYSSINIKIILRNNIISITVKLLFDLYINKLGLEENDKICEECFNQAFSLLNSLLKFSTQSILIQYLNDFFNIFYDIIFDNKNDNNRYKEIIMKLFLTLKDNLNSKSKFQKQNYQYLSISKKLFNNPFIYNMFYINNIQKNEDILHFNLDIRINLYNSIDNFYIANFINEKINQSLFILINNKNQLIVGEKILNKSQFNQLALFDNINTYILNDNNFHNVSIIIDIENKHIKLLIDYKKINPQYIIDFKNFLFDEFSVIIGYDYETVDSYNSKNHSDNCPIIDISNILIINYKNDVDNYILNTKKDTSKKQYLIDNILDDLFLNKKEYYYKFILADICFNLNDIKIINSSKYIKNNSDSFIFNKYLSKDKEIIKKYIAYIEILNPFLNNDNSKIYMVSKNDNLENYFSSNGFLTIQNINKVVLQNIFSENFNIIYSSSNNYFIDFMLGFLYNIDKRKEYISQNTELNNETNNNSIFENENINEYILIIFEIILNIPNKKTINYFLYENENISIKVKFFFKKNIYLLNNKLFLMKLNNLLNNKIENLLIFTIEIFIDLIIFPLIDVNSQNIILINIEKNLKNRQKELNEDIYPLLLKLLEKIYNIILYHQLSELEIKESNNEKQIDLILNCILLIFEILGKLNIKLFDIKIMNLTNNIINICSKYYEGAQTHDLKLFLEKNENILQKNNLFIDNNKINNQIEFITNSVSKYFAILLSKQRKKSYEDKKIDIIEDNENNNILIIDLKEKSNSHQNDDLNFSKTNTTYDTDLTEGSIIDFEDNADEQIINSKNCCFCSYLYKYFKINFDSIYEEIKYEKYKKKFYRYIFINFDESKTKLGIDKYIWYLSENESGHRSQNKFFVKENKIKIVGFKKQINDKLYRYKYMNDIENFNKNIVQLHKLFVYDDISIDQHFIFSIKNNLNFDNNITLAENCLLIKNIQKTNSLLLIYNDFLLILKNICIDNENKLHVAINDFNINIWCIKNEEYISELDEYIKNNEKEIIKNFFKNKEEKTNNNNEKEFGFNKNYKFSIKTIKFSEINEIHKVSYLQIPNSIEIITNKGKNYFLCFNIEKRDIIFFSMINNIANLNCDKFRKKKKKFSISKKTNKTTPDDCFYMKHCPINYLDNSKDNNIFSYIGQGKYTTKKLINTKIRINKKELYNKAIIDKNIFLTEIGSLWAKNRISNFDYLMLLNTLSGRSLINLSQYFIFPLILKDFDHRILNWLNKTLYRDLSVPIFACYPALKKDLSSLDIKKFELNEIGSKYHSGTFYSTHAFVSYYLVRQHPYTEIHLEIQGGEFDFADRLFIGTKELSNLEDKHQELIPSIYTLPELYINTNKFNFGKIINSNDKNEDGLENIVNDFILPKWAEEDPRKFTLVLRKILESKKVNQNLNYWIDLIFGYKMNGIEAIKSYNTFRKACYELNTDEIELLNNKGELLGTLFEKQELGYMGRQLIKKQHKKKEVILNEFKENENMFFDTNIKLRNIKLIEINKEIENTNEKIFKVNNIMIETNNEFFNNSINNKNYYYHQGGISSLKTIMNALINEYNMYSKNINLSKLINSFEKESKFIILGKKKIFLGDPLNNVVLQYNKRIIKILYNKYNAYSYYYLNEIGNISIVISNLKGTKLYIGFDNGNILIYKIKYCERDKYASNDPNYIYPFKNNIPVNNDNNNNKKRLNGSFKTKRAEINNNITEVIMLEKIKNNNFTMNNPHIPQKIKKLCLDEENNTLIATTSYNMIYIISLNNNFKLMHKIPYFTQNYYNYQYKIQDIVPLFNNGDFMVYSPLTVHLFTINGIPICELNLLDKGYNNIENITYCVVVFIYDVILFTAHKNGSIYIWKVKNKNITENFDERASSIFNNNNKSKSNKKFLPEYDYCYSFNFNINNIKDFEIQRKFDIVSQIKIDKYNFPIRYMKMSNDMSYMIVINENKKIFILSNFEEDNNININNNDNGYLLSLNKKKKVYCSWCSKEIEDCFYRATYITSIKNIKNEDNNDFEIIDEMNLFIDNEENIKEEEKKKEDNKKNKDYTYICEECRQKLGHVENYLYNY